MAHINAMTPAVPTSIAIKSAAGLLAGVIAGGLGFAFWPHAEPALISVRASVEKPVLVAVAPPAKAAVAAAPAPAPVPGAALAAQILPQAIVPSSAPPSPALAYAPTQPASFAPTPAQTAAFDKAGAEKLAAALKGAGATRGIDISNKPEIAAKPLGAPSEDAAKLCAEGLVALADGHIANARAFLERAAEAGDTRALLVLGDTWDPSTLSRLGAVGMQGDATRAHDYYAKALAAGLPDARQRLASLESRGQ